ncbi:MAG: hydroxylamine reductase [Deltaproteobacteria bacterium]|nr:hydroxylamine reductase [Deltaproteobacteria bacterium]
MFCFQCEQTAKGIGCEKIGVCGKTHEVAALQDLLIFALKNLSVETIKARKKGILDNKINIFTCKALFSTLTNVNFDGAKIASLIKECKTHIASLKEKLGDEAEECKCKPCMLLPSSDNEIESLIKAGEKVGIKSNSKINEDILSLRELLIYGMKGMASYADHAAILDHTDETIFAFIQEALAATLNENISAEDLLSLCMKCGEINIKAMEILDAANTGTYGHPVPVKVPLGAKKGKAILVSGHDLKDLEELLKQTEGKGIYIYTHGEMLPCHGYPKLKKYPHFYGHYGTGWQNQAKEFDKFPGSILMTTNCIQKPKDTYKDSIFTTGLVGFPQVAHFNDRNFAPLIEKALSMPGFAEDGEAGEVMTGFARNAVLSIADKIIEAVKTKAIKHFFLVGGCDGAKQSRSYYTEFVEKVPSDCVVLTLACGKFRFFDKKLGDINGIPRLLDIGQCNDAYSAIKIALALAEAFNCGVNDLPLSFILSWYEQKACAILLSLLYLGIKNIKLGPSLPAFVSPNVLNILVEKFGLAPISTPDQDLKEILG